MSNLMNTHASNLLYEEALRRMPGGVNSPVRAFKAVGRTPLFISRAEGAHLWDADGNRYLDFVGSWGPMILGHAHPRVIEAVRRAALSGTSFGAPTELEVRMAELICTMVPGVDVVRMVNSGTEATMSAVRLARAFTKRDRIIKFEGCYHGHGDAFLIKAGSGAMTLSVPDSPGVPTEVAKATQTATFNDSESVEAAVSSSHGTIAAVIVEPVVGNMGCVPPAPGFLQKLREICTREGIVLIFDEVMTGFRLARGGAQELFGVTPDLTTLGKVIGGGLPVGAYGGRREIMEMVAPSGPMYQAGTLSGNPLAMTAGFETLSLLNDDPSLYDRLEAKGKQLADGCEQNIRDLDLPVTLNRVGSMLTLFFTDERVTDYHKASACDTNRFARYFRSMLEQGFYFPPSQFEAAFLSDAHTERDIGGVVEANRKALGLAFG
jgi:glutamate-1-semialdehyde 2,1-aminomutase